MAKVKERAAVASQEMLADGIYSMWIRTETIASQAAAGQFIDIYPKDGAKLLPRPVSLCEIDREGGRVRIVYRVAGEGTKEFSTYRAGDSIDLLGPLGNGFPLEEAAGKRILLIGGGIGIPPMLETAKQLAAMPQAKQADIVLGYRDSQMFLKHEFEAYGAVFAATEDGSAGTKGNVLDVIREKGLRADLIFACGPSPMLRALKGFAAKEQISCYISLEERMACGIGACLACVCRSKEIDGHSHVHNKRICKDGPVFRAEEVEL